MKLLIKLQFIQKLAETQSIKFMTKFDKSYFGAKRIRGKRGRGAAGKTPVFTHKSFIYFLSELQMLSLFVVF
jgi:hypothetical protein